MTTASAIQFVGYVAAAAANPQTSPKHVAWLWEAPSGHAGLVAFTGVYWQITGWGEVDAGEFAALKRRTAKAKPAEHPWLGTSAWDVAFGRWWGRRASSTASERQEAFLVSLGAPPPAGVPRVLVGAAIDALRLAREFLQGRLQPPGLPGADALAVQGAVAALAGPHDDVETFWHRVRALDAELFPHRTAS